MISNFIKFKGIKKETISKLIGYCQNSNQCTKLLQISKTIKNTFELIIENINNIKKIPEKNKKIKEEKIIIEAKNYLIQSATDIKLILDDWKTINDFKKKR